MSVGAKLQYERICHSLTNVFFFVYLTSFKIKVIELSLLAKNVSLLNMFTFDAFLVVTQSVTGVTFPIFWLITQEWTSAQKILYHTEYIS